MNKNYYITFTMKHFGIKDSDLVKERPDFVKMNSSEKNCIRVEAIGRALLEDYGIYNKYFPKMQGVTYFNDLNNQFRGIDVAVNLGKRSCLIDEKVLCGYDGYNKNITLEIMHIDKLGRWSATQVGKATNMLVYINICLDTHRIIFSFWNYKTLEQKANDIMNSLTSAEKAAIAKLPQGGQLGDLHKTSTVNQGVYIEIPYTEADKYYEGELLLANF